MNNSQIKREIKVKEVRSLLRSKEIKAVYVYVKATYNDGVNIPVSKSVALSMFDGMDGGIETTAFTSGDKMWVG